MARNVKYAGPPPEEIYVVWSEDDWRMYASEGQAQYRYLAIKKAGKEAMLYKYSKSEILGK